MKYPEIALDAGPGFSGVKQPAHFSFPLVRVSRNDLAESFFLSNLLKISTELVSSKQPMAFPIYGRGRVLPPLEGEGINADILRMACEFLTGSCSCEIKDQNPGIDLLLAANWEAAIQGYSEIVMPSLTSVLPVQSTTNVQSGVPLPKQDDDKIQLPAGGKTDDSANYNNQRILKHVLAVMGVIAVIILIASVSMVRGKSKTEGE
jgi:hypothetical protein